MKSQINALYDRIQDLKEDKKGFIEIAKVSKPKKQNDEETKVNETEREELLSFLSMLSRGIKSIKSSYILKKNKGLGYLTLILEVIKILIDLINNKHNYTYIQKAW